MGQVKAATTFGIMGSKVTFSMNDIWYFRLYCDTQQRCNDTRDAVLLNVDLLSIVVITVIVLKWHYAECH